MTTTGEKLLHILLDTDTWVLRVISWQQSVHGVNKSGSGDYPIGEHRIDLKCRMERGLLQGDLLVGEDPSENLAGLDFTIQLRGAQKIFSALEGKDTTEDDEHATGLLRYDPPIPAENLAGLSTRIIEESKTGSVTGWALFDDGALWEVARSLPLLSDRRVYLSLTLRAAAAPEPGSLVYERHEDLPTTYRWPGKHGLVIQDIALFNTEAEKPASETPTEPEDPSGFEEAERPASETPTEPEEPSEFEITKAIERAAETLNKSIVRMSIYILILLGAILLELWRFR